MSAAYEEGKQTERGLLPEDVWRGSEYRATLYLTEVRRRLSTRYAYFFYRGRKRCWTARHLVIS